MSEPPNGLPRYRLLTGTDDDKFCKRVSEALELGYELYGQPMLVANAMQVVTGQAVVWPGTAVASA